MIPFAFYGRVSTEDQQDRAASKGWQLDRARTLIEPAGGRIVAEYFDIGQSRSLPWKRRPEAAALLGAIAGDDRPFQGVVIGEPARAFYGNQFGLTFPVLVHYGVELWVPEVGGRVDPGSDAHDLVMSLYGGMSKGERNRIKIRVRSAMKDQAHREGRFLGGRPPYGYRLVDAGAHPNPGKAADGKRLHRLEPDPMTAPVVQRIFPAYIAGLGLYAIAESLTRDGIPSPSGHDPDRNPHRQGSGGAWAKSAVRAILRNPRYTGRQVWCQRRDEVLIDVDDVALGHETRMQWNDTADWVWSAQPTHETIIDADTFAAAERVASVGGQRRTEHKRHTTERRYLLSGLVHCGVCNRRMQGQQSHGASYYRGRFPSEYALTAELAHPRNVYLAEQTVIPALDTWLARLFDADHIDETCKILAGVSEPDPSAAIRHETARRRLATCGDRLAKYRRALDAGVDPEVVGAWIREVQADQLRAEVELAAAEPATALSPDDVKALVVDMRTILRRLRKAVPAMKADLYASLASRSPTTQLPTPPSSRRRPRTRWGSVRVGGGTRDNTPREVGTTDLWLSAA
jgi:site-specific DNA recombinase